MAWHHSIAVEKRTVFVECWGEIDVAEIAQIAKQLEAEPDFDPGYQVLLDLTGLDASRLYYAHINAISHGIDPFLPTSRRAIVATEDVNFGIARMHALIRGEENTRVFTTRREALAWLGLPEEAGDAKKKPA